MPWQQTALLLFLGSRESAYSAKLNECREIIGAWLSYVPATFAHYTSHQLAHSDQIVSQLSKLLFHDGDPERPVAELSPTEAYILAAAAYLHDVGMVVSDEEKASVLASDGWKEWTTDGSGAERWRAIIEFRNGNDPQDESVRHFLADSQARFLLAEFFRRSHHRRSSRVLQEHQATFGRFAFDDSVLLRTVADVCKGHCLGHEELQDKDRYPERRDVRGDTVNVRFLAILLRLGDLLDMSVDRACPMLLSAASPLPADSLAHWTKYQRISHRLTAPDRVEIVAECHEQDEHRFLQDWCQWLVDEVNHAGVAMAQASRHRGWTPPRVTLTGADATIRIGPSEHATYIPSKWTLELDTGAVFERLIRDISVEPLSCIRELIQNALDATRCRMYADLNEEGIPAPQYPTEADPKRRDRYPLTVSLREVTAPNELSGKSELSQSLVVDDRGIGMDNDIVQRFFLQIGRSYYQTAEFRREYGFVPTSRFGVGFLSVFNVSDRVTVETFKPSSATGDGPLRLTLTGPRNYLLTDLGTRKGSGTRVEVRLREPIPPGALTDYIRATCRRVEFPIRVEEIASSAIISAERPEDFAAKIPDPMNPGECFEVRALPVDKPGVQGELYVRMRSIAQGESWVFPHDYAQTHPLARVPHVPPDMVSFHGLTSSLPLFARFSIDWSTRVDVRREVPGVTLTRDLPSGIAGVLLPEVQQALGEHLTEHLRTSFMAQGAEGWKYRQRLAEVFRPRDIGEFWSDQPEIVPVYADGRRQFWSLRDLGRVSMIAVSMELQSARDEAQERRRKVCTGVDTSDPLVVTYADLIGCSGVFQGAIFSGRDLVRLGLAHEGCVACYWQKCPQASVDFLAGKPSTVVGTPFSDNIGGPIHPTGHYVYEHAVLNSRHPLVQWLTRLRRACLTGQAGFDEERWRIVSGLVHTPLYHHGLQCEELSKYVAGYRDAPDLPDELRPPDIPITRDMFGL